MHINYIFLVLDEGSLGLTIFPCKLCSIFFEDESYYAEPKDLTSNDDGGVAVVTGRRVSGYPQKSCLSLRRKT